MMGLRAFSKLFAMIDPMPHVLTSVKALIKYQGKYLFLREPDHHGEMWDLPGGKIEYGEEPEAALLREVMEETRLQVTIDHSVGVWWFISAQNKHQVVCHTYLCSLIGEPAIDLTKNPADEDIIEYRWLSIEEALADKRLSLPDSLITLLQSLRTSEG